MENNVVSFCPNCGHKHENYEKFCGNCGFKFEDADKESFTYTPDNNGDILSSPFSMANTLKKFNCMYFIFSMIGVFLDSDTRILGGISGLALAFIVINIIAPFKVGALRNMSFTLPCSHNISYKCMADAITVPLAKINMSVETLSNSLRITCKGIEYDILINQDKGTFRIWPQKNFLRSMGSRIYTNLYIKAIYAVPLIAYTIQHYLIKTDTEDTSKYEEKLTFAEKNMNLYFKNSLRTKLLVGSGFVIAFIVAAMVSGSSGSSHYINIVKDGNLNSYNSATVGKAFDNFFTDEKWKYFESNKGKDIVEFNGNCLKNGKDCHVCVQFEINDSKDTFEVCYYSLDGETQNLLTWAGMLDKIYEKY